MTPGLYVHIPFCVAKCHYCDFFSKGGCASVGDGYISALGNEARHLARLYGAESWNTVYIGGGTPSLLSAGQIERLLESLLSATGKKSFPDEVTIEMNPETLSEDKLEACRKSGVTRLSLGIQSLNQNALSSVGRHCTSVKNLEALGLVKSCWKGRLSLDAIAGLPGQNGEEFLDSLRKTISYGPDHFSLYSLTVEEGTRLCSRIESGEVDFDSDECDRQWLEGRKILQDAGYLQYEVSNFAKKGFEARHNMLYWKQKDYLGIGAGASGTVYGGKNLRWTNTTDTDLYTEFWNGDKTGILPREEEKLSAENLEFEYLMMGLRTLEGIDSKTYAEKFGGLSPWKGNLEERLGKPWAAFRRDGLVSESESTDGSRNYALNQQGILFLNRLLLDLC